MSERKVLQKYYPPDFDPSKLERRVRGPKNAGPKVQTVRLMAPFPMKCTACGEYIYKGRKFNARKETTEEKYYSIPIYRFYIRCTRCSGEITFKTDPKNMDYTCERGAKRNTEPWRMNGAGVQESDEERLDRLEREEEEKNAMQELETKTLDAKREMQVADALDEIQMKNARNERIGKDGTDVTVVRESINEERERQEREDEEAARRAFMRAQEDLGEIIEDDEYDATTAPPIKKEAALEMPPPSFKRVVKKKKDHAAALGIKKKPSLV
ncbi:putative cell cycle control protein cwf16 [Coleophoma crateriformis]|uniref:Splicing factor YJU2 n=1 Tax=Coleophoma crateriformis TaxID=565419 RepID=A0A3D8QLH0_9HELO|nr:putative cell cycle control protein cwf16 [Coleophoma crateriformis]